MSETFNPFFLPNVGVSMMESLSTVVPESFPSSCLMSLVEAVFFHVQDALLPSESLQLISLPQVLISPEDST